MKKLIVALAALALMSGSAYAAEWNFYGTARVTTVWQQDDVIDGEDGDLQYVEGLYQDACIGAEVKVSDELSAGFEYDADGAGGTAGIEVLYGEWNFGAGSLLVGQAETPINIYYSNQFAAGDAEDLALWGFGDFYVDESPEIMLTFGGFKIAILSPATDEYEATYGDVQVVVPAIHLGYTLGFDMGEVTLAGGYATFEAGVNDENIDSYGIGAGASLNFGPVNVFGTFMYGQNVAVLGVVTSSNYQGVGTLADDCDSIGFTAGAKFTITEMFAVEAGYGYIKEEIGDGEDEGQSYYIQAPITVAPGVTITPEVGMIDDMDSGQNERLYFGAGWEIAF
ncbi:porin [uncultured Desulfobacter sp.]|uniref:porin n=1 Tax=uncultured Desulfobacter sp. TaxID=240139 RepID=UPI002AAB7347|nr:porin [uncultured Desulfobacter sp.]